MKLLAQALFLTSCSLSCSDGFEGKNKFKLSSSNNSGDSKPLEISIGEEKEVSDEDAIARDFFGDGKVQPLDFTNPVALLGGDGDGNLEFEPKIIELTDGCVHRNNTYSNRNSPLNALKKCTVHVDLNEHFDFEKYPDVDILVNFKLWGYAGLNGSLPAGLYQTPPPSGSCGTDMNVWVGSVDAKYDKGIKVNSNLSQSLKFKRSGGVILNSAPEQTPHPGEKWVYAGLDYDKDSKGLELTNAGNGWGACSAKSGDGCAACVSSIVLVIAPAQKTVAE